MATIGKGVIKLAKMLKDAAILFVITLISGAILGYVYDLTKGPIAEQEALAKAQAMQQVFADAAGFELLFDTANEDTSVIVSEIDDSGTVISADFADVNDVYIAQDSAGETLGYVITVTSHEGYGGDIKFSMGVRNDGTINGLSLLSISETAGLGMKAGEVLVPQFAGKCVEHFTYTKTGSTSDSEIDAISGATITTNAVTNAVNMGLSLFQQLSAEGGV